MRLLNVVPLALLAAIAAHPLSLRAADTQTTPTETDRMLLNGTWELTLSQSESEQDLPGADSRWIDIPVPSLYTRVHPYPLELTGVPKDWQQVHCLRVGWYKRTLTIPANWKDKRILLRGDQATFAIDAYLDGQWVGQHIGGQTPFTFDLTPYARPGTAQTLLIAVRSVDHFKVGEGVPNSPAIFPGVTVDGQPIQTLNEDQVGEIIRSKKPRDIYWFENPDSHNPSAGFGLRSGIQADIWLVARGRDLDITRQKVETTVNGGKRLRTQTWVRNRLDHPQVVRLERTVYDAQGKVALELPTSEVIIQPGEEFLFTDNRPWEDVRLWGIGGDYGEPYLYWLRSTVRLDGEAIDSDSVRFGFRQLSVGDPLYTDAEDEPQDPLKLYLNNRQIFLQADCVGWISHGMEGVNRPALEKFIAILQGMGVNTLRPHTHQVMPDIFYQVADEMGMMIADQYSLGSGSVPYLDWQVPADGDPRWVGYYDHLRRELRAWIEGSWNHPSIISWVPENEVISHNRLMPDRAQGLKDLMDFMRTVDTTRLIYSEGSRSMDLAGSGADLAVLHYPFPRRIDPATGNIQGRDKHWSEVLQKPTIIGEDVSWEEFLAAMEIRGRKYENMEQETRDLETHGREFQQRQQLARDLGFSGYSYWHISNYAFGGGPDARTPWDIPFGASPQTVAVTWPAQSGFGSRPEQMTTFVRRPNCRINWYDPTLPLFTPSPFYDDVVDVWADTPYAPWTQGHYQLSPEVIVATGTPGAWVTATPTSAFADWEALTLQADSEGRAWFTLPFASDYTLTWTNADGNPRQLDYQAQYRHNVSLEPGYAYIPVISLPVTDGR
ncbi:MAG: glycoside hydrolase family 2 TIM barrel-domain containing protein [Verrucomicrobiota bacterium JB024]|nr:glycoside hydrolase family 2 TIM barrel-domain containing protein [Verrucomicrobiota bacterium JB024]